jgi:hypothetical protein
MRIMLFKKLIFVALLFAGTNVYSQREGVNVLVVTSPVQADLQVQWVYLRSQADCVVKPVYRETDLYKPNTIIFNMVYNTRIRKRVQVVKNCTSPDCIKLYMDTRGTAALTNSDILAFKNIFGI